MRDRGVHTESRIELERGRFVVYLDVFMADERGRLDRVEHKRIDEYPTRRAAEIAAEWMVRAARRKTDGPTGH